MSGAGSSSASICNQSGYASLSQFQIMIWTVGDRRGVHLCGDADGAVVGRPDPDIVTFGHRRSRHGGGLSAKSRCRRCRDRRFDPGEGHRPACRGAAWRSQRRAGLGSAKRRSGAFLLTRSSTETPAGAGAWTTATGGGAVPDALFEVTGLNATTRYEFQVVASNASGPGPGDKQSRPPRRRRQFPRRWDRDRSNHPTLGNPGSQIPRP